MVYLPSSTRTDTQLFVHTKALRVHPQRNVRNTTPEIHTMLPTAGYELEPILRSELEGLKLFFSGLNTQIAKLDHEYKKHGIYYHSIFPECRDEKYGDYELGPNNELPKTVSLIRGLDTTARNASVMLRRNDVLYVPALHNLREDVSERLEETKCHVNWLKERLAHLSFWTDEIKDSDRILAEGPALFDLMWGNHRTSFTRWASHLREVKIGLHLGKVKTCEDMVQLVLGEEERFVLEWPEITDVEKFEEEDATEENGDDQQREAPTEAEVELLERFGPGAAVGFL
jgi:hypothetical protein